MGTGTPESLGGACLGGIEAGKGHTESGTLKLPPLTLPWTFATSDSTPNLGLCGGEEGSRGEGGVGVREVGWKKGAT